MSHGIRGGGIAPLRKVREFSLTKLQRYPRMRLSYADDPDVHMDV